MTHRTRFALAATIVSIIAPATFAVTMNPLPSGMRIDRSNARLEANAVKTEAPATEATTLFSTGFETSGSAYASGSSLTAAANGWTRDGTGGATTLVSAPLARTGSNSASFVPAASGSWVYRTSTVHSGAALAAEPLVTASTSLRITSPATGTANRSLIGALQMYDTSVNMIADFTLAWDADGTLVTGGPAGELYLFADWFFDTNDTTGSSFAYTLGNFTSASLANAGWVDLALSLDYSTGDIAFSINGVVETQHGTFDPNSFVDFSDADYFYSRGTTGTTVPRLLGDNYSVVTAAVPEPTSMAALAGLALVSRRRRA